MNALSSTWTFKCNCYTNDHIKKSKAFLGGDQQIEGVDYYKTYAPVVMKRTIRLMPSLEYLLDLKYKQGDMTCVYQHAHLPDEENIYIHVPQEFTQYDKRDKVKVVKLKHYLYGLRNRPRAFWKFMVEKL